MVRRVAMALTAVLLLLTLAGCTGRTIVISWSPNPVVVVEGQQEINGKVSIRTTGTLGSLRIDSIKVEALDDQDNVTWDDSYKINRTIPLFINVNHTEPVTLPVTYDDVTDHGVSKVRVTVSGSDPGVLEVEIKAESPDPT